MTRASSGGLAGEELQHCAHGGAEVLCTVLAEEWQRGRRGLRDSGRCGKGWLLDAVGGFFKQEAKIQDQDIDTQGFGAEFGEELKWS